MDLAELGFVIDSSQAASAADNLDKMSAASQRAQTGTEKLQASVDKMGSSARAYTQFGREIQQFLDSEAKSLDDVADRMYAYNQALQAGILTQKQYGSALQELAKQQAALESQTGKTTSAHGAMIGSMKLTSFQMMEVGRIMKDLATGQTALLERSVFTLGASTGALGAIFTATGAAIAAIAAIVAGAAAAFIQHERVLQNYSKELILTGQSGIETASQLRAASDAVGASTGHYLDAQKAIADLVATGKFIGPTLETAARGAVSFAELTGESVEKAVQAFVKLADEPLKASEKLDAQYHYLSVSQLVQIANLEKMGDKAGAAAVAAKAFADAMIDRDAEVKANLTGWAKLWDDVKAGIGGAFIKLGDFLARNEEALASYAKLAAFAANPLAAISTNAYASAKVANQFSNVQSGSGVPSSNYIDQIATALNNAQAAWQVFNKSQQDASTITKKFVVDAIDETEKLKTLADTADKTQVSKVNEREKKALDDLKQAVGENSAAYKAGAEQIALYAAQERSAALIADQATAARKHHHDVTKDLYAVERDLNKVIDDGLKLADRVLNGDDALGKATTKYNEEIDKLAQAWDALNAKYALGLITHDELVKKEKELSDASAMLGESFDEEREKIEALRAGLFGLVDRYQKAIDEARGMTEQQKLVVKATDDASQVWAKHKVELEAAGITFDQVKDKLVNMAEEEARVREETKQNTEAARQWQSIWEQAGNGVVDLFGKVLFEGGSLFKGLADLAKQTVMQIIAYFARLAIINPILNSIFAPGGVAQSGFQLLPELANAGGSGGGSSPLGMLGQGMGLFGGSGSQSLLGSFFGSGDFDMGFGNMLSSGGGIGGALGTLGGAFGGFQLGQALGLGTGGSAALGAGVGALSYFVPVVGWIMGAASLINSLTGGGLFGTQWKPTGQSSSDITLGASGGTVQDFVQESKKKAFFGGRSWKDVAVAASADQVSAVNQMFDTLKKSVQAGADALGVQMPELIGGSFKQVFDKNGKVTSELSTVLGQTYKETVQQFAERVTAENLLALLPAAQEASKIAQQWRSSADTLMAGTQMLVQAQADINKGMGLLGSDGSLANITKVVQDLQQQGETLVQTYVRLHVEVSSLQATLGDLGLTTDKTGADLVKFADSLTTAAGGMQNLTTLWNDYYQNYFSSSEQAANTLKHLQEAVTTTFAAIGEDPKESMAKFRADFEKAFPTLTPQQIVQWLQAGAALAALNKQLGTTASEAQAAATAKAMQAYGDFIGKFDPVTIQTTAFESSLTKLNTTLGDNIRQAYDLAKAAGMAGPSLADIGKIIAASAQDGVNALHQFEAQVQSLAASLFGTNAQQLQQQITDLKTAQSASAQLPGMDAFYQQQIDAKQKELDAANAQAQQLKQFTDATTLLQDFGQIGAITGESIDQLAQRFGVPMDKFAQYLGINADQLKQQYAAAETQAQAAIKANDYLAQILATLQGKTPQIGAGNLPISLRSPGASGPVQTVAESESVVKLQATADKGNQQSASDMATNNQLLREQNDLLRQLVRQSSGGNTMPILRNYGGPQNTRVLNP